MVRPFQGPYSVDIFMRDYWQKRPMILRNAFRESSFDINLEDFFVMATMEHLHSRIIFENAEDQSWDIEIGSFELDWLENSLGPSHWTLLVQDTEQYLHQMHELLELFRFIPNWRLDDVQLSYATTGGSAGPHVDSYDVFLIQISGKRQWKIENAPVTDDRPMIENAALKLLKELNPDQEFTAKPGDMLYLPPKFPHWGIAVGPCITASIGFKAPEINMLQTAISVMTEGLNYTPGQFVDSAQSQSDDPGYVPDAPIDWFQNEMRQLAEDREILERVFCSSVTHPVRANWPGAAADPVPSAEEIPDDLRQGSTYVRFTPSCMVYREFDDCIRIYVLGIECERKRELKPFAQLLTGTETLNFDSLKSYLGDKDVRELLQFLLDSNALIRVEWSNS